MKLYTNGVLVVGMTEIEDKNNNKEKPYENTGIKEGDSIIKVNNQIVNTAEDLVKEINKSNGNEIDIEYKQNTELYDTKINPALVGDDYKIGLWVRDSQAGVGTLTFYEPTSNTFMSLGHGIQDVDTGDIVEISNGELVTASIVSITKGQKDIPGEIRGTITNGTTIGKIAKNTDFGVYGVLTNKDNIKGIEAEVANRNEIEQGKAFVICQLDNEEPKKYEAEIEKVYYLNDKDNKSMQIKITDEELIKKTGGIIQGMSGAPIIQNNRFVGAITNVLVKDPTKGYAVFADIMLKEMHK